MSDRAMPGVLRAAIVAQLRLVFGNAKNPGGVACPRATRDRSGVFVL